MKSFRLISFDRGAGKDEARCVLRACVRAFRDEFIKRRRSDRPQIPCLYWKSIVQRISPGFPLVSSDAILKWPRVCHLPLFPLVSIAPQCLIKSGSVGFALRTLPFLIIFYLFNWRNPHRLIYLSWSNLKMRANGFPYTNHSCSLRLG